MYNQYRDGKDLGSYLCGDTIVDVVALCPNNVSGLVHICMFLGMHINALLSRQTNRIIAVLACSGRVLRLLEHCRVRQTVELDSVPTVLYVPERSHGDRLLCGYADGKITLIVINHFGMDGTSDEIVQFRECGIVRFCVSSSVSENILIEADLESSAVTALSMFDLSAEGKDDLLVGRRDGTVQVFSMPDDSDVDSEVRCIYSEVCAFGIGW